MREQGAGVGSECCCDIAMRRKQCRSNDVFDGMAKMGGKGHEESSSWGVPVPPTSLPVLQSRKLFQLS
jgi:hypothetical protein